MAKKFLSKELIDRYINENQKTKNYIKNPEKRQLFKEIINSNFLKTKGNESRITAFNKLWRKSQRVARIIYGGTKNISQRSQIAANFVRENTYYRSSFLQNFSYSKKVDIETSIHNAEYKTFSERLSKFLNKYGDTQVQNTYGRLNTISQGSGLTLNDYMEKYKNGEISKEEMSTIIKNFKESNTYYFKMSIGSD